ncbi:MAG: NUDIX hydrolase [Lawsonella sp.]|uniref:NUDIX hydrolase n=1 Tax=Lawsonella sp. TaxID=2041415 RepID=UPI002A750286|nr:NUDIX hydrolase [Lawsonella sp.]MDY2978941.1 NUDIX hydrolase [Lawsonella sp.]
MHSAPASWTPTGEPSPLAGLVPSHTTLSSTAGDPHTGALLADNQGSARKWFVYRIDARNSPDNLVLAAGGVVWRRSKSGELEVLLEHRKRYNDWSIPKGKIDPGESPVMTAIREIAEETGFQVRLGKFLKRVQYSLSGNRDKVVFFWSAEVIGGKFRANSEVDRIAWLPVAEAEEKIQYESDRKVLQRFLKADVAWHPVILVRHGRAGERGTGAEDVLRPLDAVGRQQAVTLAEAASAYGVTELYTADRVRCEQTMLPTSQLLNLPLKVERTLSEEAALIHPDDTVDFWLEMCERAAQDEIPMVCSQGGVIPTLLEEMETTGGIALDSRTCKCKKGGMWVIFVDDHGIAKAADYLPSPLAVR